MRRIRVGDRVVVNWWNGEARHYSKTGRVVKTVGRRFGRWYYVRLSADWPGFGEVYAYRRRDLILVRLTGHRGQ